MAENSFAQRLAAHRRISILRTLAAAPGYGGNDSLLQMMVEDFGLTASRDQVRSDLAWLRDQGLVTLREIAGVYIAQSTTQGLDVAAGRITVPGVQRPSPD